MATKKTSGKPATTSAAGDIEKLVRVNFEVTAAEHLKLKVHAAKAGRTISDVLREFVAKIRD